jgi:hypothetical protein
VIVTLNIVAQYSDRVMIGKWRDEWEVNYISTEFKNTLVTYQDKRNHEKTKPLPIVNYNKGMDGVDRQVQLCGLMLKGRISVFCCFELIIHSIFFLALFHMLKDQCQIQTIAEI